MRPIVRSFVRILSATVLALAVLLGAATVLVTQPTFGTATVEKGPRADPARLRRDVEVLTERFSPRDSDHPELVGRDVRAAVSGMICLDMIGYFTPRQPAPNLLFRLLYPSRGDFVAVAGRWDDRGLAHRVKRAMRGAGTVPVVSFTAPCSRSSARRGRLPPRPATFPLPRTPSRA